MSEFFAIRNGASEGTKFFFPLILVDSDDEGKQAAERSVGNMILEELGWRTTGFASWLKFVIFNLLIRRGARYKGSLLGVGIRPVEINLWSAMQIKVNRRM